VKVTSSVVIQLYKRVKHCDSHNAVYAVMKCRRLVSGLNFVFWDLTAVERTGQRSSGG
jgi:hypothetical protein